MGGTVEGYASITGSLSVTLPGSVVAGDFIVLLSAAYDGEGFQQVATAVSGCGATWVHVGSTTDLRHGVWLGLEPTSTGVITVVRGGRSNSGCVLGAYLVRGIPAEVAYFGGHWNTASGSTQTNAPAMPRETTQLVLTTWSGTNPGIAADSLPPPVAAPALPPWSEVGGTVGTHLLPGNGSGPTSMRLMTGASTRNLTQVIVGPASAVNPPTGLVLDSKTSHSLTVDWTAPVSGPVPTGYEYRINGGTAVSVGTALTATITGLTKATAYTIEVRAKNGLTTVSAWTPVLNATTLDAVATRYYLSLNPPPVSPPRGSWWAPTTAATTRGKLVTAPDTIYTPSGSSGHVNVARSKAGTVAGTGTILFQCVSDPLPAGVQGGSTLDATTQLGSLNLFSAQAWFEVSVRVVSGDGTIERGVLYSGPGGTASSTDNASNVRQAEPNSRRKISNVPLAEVIAEAGDRLVVEYGIRSMHQYDWSSLQMFYGAITTLADLPLTNDPDNLILTHNAWVDIYQDIPEEPTATIAAYVGSTPVTAMYLGSTPVEALFVG